MNMWIDHTDEMSLGDLGSLLWLERLEEVSGHIKMDGQMDTTPPSSSS